ncbi:hypothetical protein LLH23_10155, partial [bacterium]|nr:hypothetical protein [bacterium]
MRAISLCTLLLTATACYAQQADLTAFEWGAMPTAVAAVPDMAYRPTFVLDGKPETGWVTPLPPVAPRASDLDTTQVWLRLEWRFPVTISQVEFRQFTGGAFSDLKPITSYALQVERAFPPDWRGQWNDVEGAMGPVGPSDQPTTIAPAKPVRTRAIRLLLRGPAQAKIGLSEVKVLGEKPVLPMSFAPTWKAMWIWVEPSLVLPHREPERRYMRRSFEVADPAQVKEAWLMAVAADRGVMYLNAREVWRDASYNGGIQRPARLVKVPTDLLRAGENVLAAQVEDIYEVGSRGLLAELVLIGRDGSRTIIPTDDQWTGQSDAGVHPDWMKPGTKDTRFVPARPFASGNGLWHWFWSVRYPVVAPAQTATVTDLRTDPSPLVPGAPAKLTVTLDVPQKPAADYALILRLGEDSQVRDHDFDLFGAVAPPEELKTSAWQPGRHTVTLNVDIPREAPARTPATVLLSRPD